jgi:hypothetical protein
MLHEMRDLFRDLDRGKHGKQHEEREHSHQSRA